MTQPNLTSLFGLEGTLAQEGGLLGGPARVGKVAWDPGHPGPGSFWLWTPWLGCRNGPFLLAHNKLGFIMGRGDFAIGSRGIFIEEMDVAWSDLKKYVLFSAVAPLGSEKKPFKVRPNLT